MNLPESLEHWRTAPGGAEWLAALPRLAAECAAQWDLELEEPVDTPHSLVVPAGDAVLKLNAPSHFEADHEAEALAHWAGEGAVRLLGRDETRRALLIERCIPGTRLDDVSDDATEVVARLLPRLWRAPADGHPFRDLGDEAARWAEDVPRRYDLGGRPFERSLVDFAVAFLRDAGATQGAQVVANQDLHGGNILRARREPWLVVDPKPLVGERELERVGLLRNTLDRPEAPEAVARRWLGALTELGLDRDRLRGWGVAHTLAWGWDASGWSERAIARARAIRDA